MNFWQRGVATLLLVTGAATSNADDNSSVPTVERGATVYAERCVLCHGRDGRGEGVLALKIEGYPDTNLLTNIKAADRLQVSDLIVHGGYRNGYSDYMPPYGNEISWTDIESVTAFILRLREDPDKAQALVEKVAKATMTKNQSVDVMQSGKNIYQTRCVLCHGTEGKGDGRMSKIIKTPPPFNLTLSRLPDDYLREIIVKGGAAVGRSKHMPPWGDQLSDEEITGVIAFLKSLRK